MSLNSGSGRFKRGIFNYFKGTDSLDDQPLPEVEKALVDDAPRIVRLTIWGVIGFFVFLVLWAHFAIIDEVTKGEGKAIPSSRIQKIQNLEGEPKDTLEASFLAPLETAGLKMEDKLLFAEPVTLSA